jgi:DNA-binding IclR family transcriptional regulator
MQGGVGGPGWSVLSNHGKVLLCVAHDPYMRVTDIAASVGIKERAVHRILAELRAEGFITSTREGRRNRYTIDRAQRLRWAPRGVVTVGQLVDVLRR